MSYYCLLASAYTGHLNPMTVLGRELKKRGHRIVVVAPLDAQAKVQRSGLEFLPVATVEFPAGAWERSAAQMGGLAGLNASRSFGHSLGRFARGIMRELPSIATREQFDGLVMDQIGLGTESVCDTLNLPMAVACCALALHAESRVPPMIFSWPYRPSLPFRLRNQLGLLLAYGTGWPVMVELLRFRREHRLPRVSFHHLTQLPPSLVQVSQQPAFFDFPRRRLPRHFHYTGPWKEPWEGDDGQFPWSRLDSRPLIFASMGTLQNRLPNVFRIIAEACAGLEAQLVVALGRKGASTGEVLPGNPIIVDYAPQEQLLRRTALVISHGGLNTTLEALSEGVPQVVVPIANDQPGVAARMARLGIGEFIRFHQLTGATMREAVCRVMSTPSYRERSAHLAREVRRVNGPALAADLIETAFRSRQRVLRAPAAGSARLAKPTA